MKGCSTPSPHPTRPTLTSTSHSPVETWQSFDGRGDVSSPPPSAGDLSPCLFASDGRGFSAPRRRRSRWLWCLRSSASRFRRRMTIQNERKHAFSFHAGEERPASPSRPPPSGKFRHSRAATLPGCCPPPIGRKCLTHDSEAKVQPEPIQSRHFRAVHSALFNQGLEEEWRNPAQKKKKKRKNTHLFLKCYLYFILQLCNDVEKVPFECIYCFFAASHRPVARGQGCMG